MLNLYHVFQPKQKKKFFELRNGLKAVDFRNKDYFDCVSYHVQGKSYSVRMSLLLSQVGEAVEIVTGDTNKSKEITEVFKTLITEGEWKEYGV